MSDIYARNIFNELKKWVERREIFAIKGPRQAGKTTLMLMLKDHLLQQGVAEEQIVFLPCDDVERIEPFVSDPKSFVRSNMNHSKRKYYFFLDEYQYVPNGGQTLKVLYDAFPNVKFIISGSSSLELTSKTAKYLVGRIFFFTLYSFSFGEFIHAKDVRLGRIYAEKNQAVVEYLLDEKPLHIEKDIFLKNMLRYFEEYLVFGGYPEVIKAHDLETKKMILKNIYETYIHKDIIELLKITDTITFRNTIRLLAAQHGGMLHFESLASDAKSYYREIKRFLSVLEETYILTLLIPFHKNLSTELKKNPKAYFLDPGLRNVIVKNFHPIPFREDRGKLAEGFVLTGLMTQLQGEAEIKYWRTLAKAEVDFVLLTGQDIIPVEVKYRGMTKPKMSRSLRNFIHAYQPKKAIVVTKDFWHSMKFNRTQIAFVPSCYL